jgi:hypothetical protein
MAAGTWQNDKNKRVVCLKKENSSEMQLWNIERTCHLDYEGKASTDWDF